MHQHLIPSHDSVQQADGILAIETLPAAATQQMHKHKKQTATSVTFQLHICVAFEW